MISALRLSGGETVIEIGAGHGELTGPLVRACAEKNCALVAVEKDKTLTAGYLYPLQEQHKNFAVVEGDILITLKSIDAVRNGLPYKLAGNLPYYITGNLLRRISGLPHKPVLSVLMVQKEVAERIAAAPPRMNRLGASVQFWAEPRIVLFLGKEDFAPAPDVDSAIIALAAKNSFGADPECYYRMVRILFAQPRKTILNNVAAGTGTSKKETLSALKSAGVGPELRPQNLAREDILALANLFPFPKNAAP